MQYNSVRRSVLCRSTESQLSPPPTIASCDASLAVLNSWNILKVSYLFLNCRICNESVHNLRFNIVMGGVGVGVGVGWESLVILGFLGFFGFF